MSLSFTSALALAMLNFFTGKINDGTAVAGGYVRVYAGVKPTNVRTALAGNTVLAELPSPADAFADATVNDAGGYCEALAAAIADIPAAADGTATFFRQFNRDNVAIYQGDVGLSGSGAEMELSNVALIAGINVVVQSYIIRQPMG